MRICGSPNGMINAQEFGDLVELFGWPPDKTVDCFRFDTVLYLNIVAINSNTINNNVLLLIVTLFQVLKVQY